MYNGEKSWEKAEIKLFEESVDILLNKSKKKIGDIGIKVVVGKDYNDNELNFRCLQNISLSKIMDLSKKISDGIIKTFE